MTISIDDFLLFSDRTIDGWRRAIDRLDEAGLSPDVRPPELSSANTPFALTAHAWGATEWWCRHIILGQPVDRYRDGEFVATGTIAEARTICDRMQLLLHELAPAMAEAEALAVAPETQMPVEGEWTVGAALIHVYEELAQHLGHLEITVDLLLASTADDR